MDEIKQLVQQHKYEEAIFRTEAIILGNDELDTAIFGMFPKEVLHRSPLVMKAYGEALLSQGQLLEAKKILLLALKGLAYQTFRKQFLSAFALLAQVHLLLGEPHEAKPIIKFLYEAYERKEDPLEGEVMLALAGGVHLIDSAADAMPFYETSFQIFVEAGEPHKSCKVLSAMLRNMCPVLNNTEWERRLNLLQQKVIQLPEWRSLIPYLLSLRAYYNKQWETACRHLQQIVSDQLPYPFAPLAPLLYRKAANRWSEHHHIQQENLLTFDNIKISMPSTENIELQYEFTCVQFYEHAANADIEQASLALEKARMFTEIGLSPLLAFELEQMNEILNAKRKYKPKPKRKPDTKTAQTPWKVQCFGGLEMMRSGEVVKNIHWKRKKAQELFMFLLLRPHYSAQKEQVIEALFAQSDPEQVTNQLYVTVHRLKEILKQYLGGQPGIVTKDGIIRLDEQTIQSVDAEQYETLIRVGNQLWTTDRDLAMELYEKAYQLYAPLAPEVQYVDWLEQYRDKLLVMQTDIIRKLGQDALQKQRLERSELFFREWISLQPHHEEAYQHLIKLLLQSGRRAEALYWYKLLEQVCVEELGTEPTEETRRMVLGTIL